MARLLAAEVVAALAHRLDDIAVADRRAHERAADRLEGALETEVAHDRRDHRRLREGLLLVHRPGAEPHQRVAVEDLAPLVDHDHAVGVAVEGDADVGPQLADLGRRPLGMQRAALVVDVAPVRLAAELEDLGAELAEHRRADAVAGAVRAVDHDAHALEGEVPGKGVLQVHDIAAAGVVDAVGLADLVGGRRGSARPRPSRSAPRSAPPRRRGA